MPRIKLTPQTPLTLREMSLQLAEFAAQLDASASSLERQGVQQIDVGGDIDTGLERTATFVKNARKAAAIAGRLALQNRTPQAD